MTDPSPSPITQLVEIVKQLDATTARIRDRVAASQTAANVITSKAAALKASLAQKPASPRQHAEPPPITRLVTEVHQPTAQSSAVPEEYARVVAQLEQENQILKESLDDYESGLNLVMDKHRQQLSQLAADHQAQLEITEQQLAAERQRGDELDAENAQLRARVQEMLEVLRSAATSEHDDLVEAERWNRELVAENEGLRQMLLLSGSPLPPSPVPVHAEQTNEASA